MLPFGNIIKNRNKNPFSGQITETDSQICKDAK
jgi:hypothetical protein